MLFYEVSLSKEGNLSNNDNLKIDIFRREIEIRIKI